MASKLQPSKLLEPKKGGHLHFVFTLRYNCVERKHYTLKKCDKEKGVEYYYQSQNQDCCILVQTFKGIRKPASERKLDNLSVMQPFSDFMPNINLQNLDTYKDKLILKNELQKAIGRDVVAVKDVEEVMDRFISEMAAVANEGQIVCTMADVRCLVYERRQELHSVKKC